MSIEIKSDEEVKKDIAENENAVGVYSRYDEGEPLVKTFLGKKYFFTIDICDECKHKIIISSNMVDVPKKLCIKCANKKLEEWKERGDEIIGLVREKDKRLWELCEEKIIERELDKGEAM